MNPDEVLIATILILAVLNILLLWFVGKGWATRKKSKNGWRD